MNKRITVLIAVSALVATTASAAVFVNPTLALFPPATPAILGPVVTSLSSSVVDDAGNFAATLTTSVHSGGSNPLGGLTFVYTISNDLFPVTAADDLYAFGVLWDPAYTPVAVDVDTTVGLGVVPFSFALTPNGLVFSFNFLALPAGSTSVAVAIGTAAPSWTIGDAGIINGTTEDALGLVPVPEPSTYALLAGIGLVGFACWRRCR